MLSTGRLMLKSSFCIWRKQGIWVGRRFSTRFTALRFCLTAWPAINTLMVHLFDIATSIQQKHSSPMGRMKVNITVVDWKHWDSIQQIWMKDVSHKTTEFLMTNKKIFIFWLAKGKINWHKSLFLIWNANSKKMEIIENYFQ